MLSTRDTLQIQTHKRDEKEERKEGSGGQVHRNQKRAGLAKLIDKIHFKTKIFNRTKKVYFNDKHLSIKKTKL